MDETPAGLTLHLVFDRDGTLFEPQEDKLTPLGQNFGPIMQALSRELGKYKISVVCSISTGGPFNGALNSFMQQHGFYAALTKGDKVENGTETAEFPGGIFFHPNHALMIDAPFYQSSVRELPIIVIGNNPENDAWLKSSAVSFVTGNPALNNPNTPFVLYRRQDLNSLAPSLLQAAYAIARQRGIEVPSVAASPA